MTDQILDIVEELGEKIREVSIAEFFEKNRHLLGYENPTKSLLTVVKELVDNSLDACFEARILPDIKVQVKPLSKTRFKVKVDDNGPGLPPKKIPIAFGKFLVGSKFYRLRQSIGTQGIGAKGAILYAQLTTGKPAKIISYYKNEKHVFELMIDVLKNEPHILSHKIEKIDKNKHGLSIEIIVEGRYVEGQQSIPTYLKYIAIANPYAKIVFDGPNGKVVFERKTKKLPPLPKEIKPHPYGVELGKLKRMLKMSKAKNLLSFLSSEFSRVSRNTALKICKLAKVDCNKKPNQVSHEEAEKLHKAMQMVKLLSPPTNCLSPLNEQMLIDSLKNEFPKAEFITAIIRKPTVYRGYPFQVQVALAYGEELGMEKALLLRFANHTPLLYNMRECAITKAAQEVNWRNYGLSQSEGSLPNSPLIILVDFISVWIPYTSEGKEAIANYPEIVKEIKLALQDAGRKLATFVRKKKRMKERILRKQIFERYIPEVAKSLSKLIKKSESLIYRSLEKIVKEKLEGWDIGDENVEIEERRSD
ncbi:MAG: DNA topoisomerase VI subunit B [Candidatus Aenigmarchaeota archaeon ex4484_224]|nr:MAG: DNA topoisomerase VI subunit B [Candidatus Aenigmarchaeota archaeon ex4484_224]